jgi:hypothetical protein
MSLENQPSSQADTANTEPILDPSRQPPACPTRKVHLLSVLVRRKVQHDQEHGIFVGDLCDAARDVQQLHVTMQEAVKVSDYPLPAGCNLNIFPAENVDASDFRVAFFLESAVVSEVELLEAARSTSHKLQRVIEWVGTASTDLETFTLIDPLGEAEQKLGREMFKVAKTVEFTLLNIDAKTESILRIVKRAPTEKNAVVDNFEARGRIVGIPKRSEVDFECEKHGKLSVKVADQKTQTIMALCFAAGMPVSVRLVKLKSDSTLRTARKQWFQLEKICKVDVSDERAASELRLAIGVLEDLLGSEVSLFVSPSGPSSKARNHRKKWGEGTKLGAPN